MRTIDRLDKVPPDVVAQAAASTTPGLTDEQAGAMPRARRDPHRPTRRSSRRCGRWASRTRLLDEGLDELAAVIDGCASITRSHASRPTCASRAGSTTTPGRCSRPGWPATSRSARSARAAATTRSPRTARPPIPAWASRSGVTRLLMPLFQRGVLDAARARCRRPCWSRCRTRTTARAATAIAQALRSRGIADRGRGDAAEVRQADPLRRAARHPVRLVPDGDDDADEVKDIRSGDQGAGRCRRVDAADRRPAPAGDLYIRTNSDSHS